MIFIVAINYDGETIHKFDLIAEAEVFCMDFLKQYQANYGGKVLAFEGKNLSVTPVKLIDGIKLE